MATRRVKSGGSGRLRLAFLLIAFLMITGTVILRRSYGNRGARELVELDSRRAALVAERLRLEAEIRSATSRARIEPIATQRLQMHIPSDSQVILVPPSRSNESQ
jgi:cell division protein FtsL